ncbi:hypothetical protein A6E13_16380 [Aliivibrio fischeri]|uniref:recombinase family protein n=1 Tax=Aliivibrio fischeri TaxID=668 RepID=UPI00080DF8D5|nr:recombinase family protein [Aliivibrio fischeri]OCH31799.1 hypothetical protein A6E13_16380 [Aliivibrio fischeri]
MKYGYVTQDNDIEIQMKALQEYGCDEIECDKEITELIAQLCTGDIIVVWRLDKLASSISVLQKKMADIHAAGAAVLSLQEQFNSVSPNKMLFEKIMGAVLDAEK